MGHLVHSWIILRCHTFGSLKMFNQKLFNENDARAREKAKLLLSNNFIVKDNPDDYGVDLICYRKCDNKKFYVEVEVKLLWSGQKFPWSDINILGRKEKYFKVPNTMMLMFNTDLTSCFIVSGKTILESPKVEVSNYRNPSGEMFFKVPYTKMIHHKNI